MRENKIDAWHFGPDSRILAHQNDPAMVIAPGFVYSEDAPIVICENGLHGSRTVRDALKYAPGCWLSRVQMWGDVIEHNDKLVSRHRRVVACRDVRMEIRLWACWCVRNTPLSDGRTTWDLLTDKRSRNAVEVAELFARGEATSEQLANAYHAGYHAAYHAAACYAVNAAAYHAAYDAYHAAYHAACHAVNAANAAKFQAAELDRRMLELFTEAA